MLVLSRERDEAIRLEVAGGIRILIVDVRGDKVRLGIEAPPHVHIIREELLRRPVDAAGNVIE